MCTCFIKGSWFQVPCSFFQFLRFRYCRFHQVPRLVFQVSFTSFKVLDIRFHKVSCYFHQFTCSRNQVPSNSMFRVLSSLYQCPGSYKCHMSQVYISGSFTRFLLQFWGSNDLVPSSDQFLDSRFKVQLFSTINSSFKQ